MATTLAQKQTKLFFKWLDKTEVKNAILSSCLFLGAAFCIGVNGLSLTNHLTRSYAIDPVEASLVVEASRIAQGTNDLGAATAVTTHAYGWLSPHFLAVFARVMPLTNQTGRYISFACALATIVLLCTVFASGQRWTFQLFAFATLLSIQGNGEYFAQNRPDMIALLLCVLFVMGFYQGLQRENLTMKLGATVLLLIATAFKQTATAWALIPALAVLFDSKGKMSKDWLFALLPVFFVTAYFACMKFIAPDTFATAMTDMTEMTLPLKAIAQTLWATAQANPLLTALLLASAVAGKPRASFAPWMHATLLVLFFACCTSMAKHTGQFNNLLPLHFAVAAYCIDSLKHYFKRPVAKLGVPIALMVLWLVQCFPNGPVLNRYYLLNDARQTAYTETVNYVSGLPGTVVSPEDPTIALFGHGNADRNFFMEFDARGGWVALPGDLTAYVSNANYAVEAVGGYATDILRAGHFQTMGFTLDRDFGDYVVWKKR